MIMLAVWCRVLWVALYFLAFPMVVNAEDEVVDHKETVMALQDALLTYQLMGEEIALSLLQCERIGSCAKVFHKKELDLLIGAIESDIDTLMLGQRFIEDEDKDVFIRLLHSYQKQRDSYLAYHKKIMVYLDDFSETNELDILEEILLGGDELEQLEGELVRQLLEYEVPLPRDNEH